MIFCLRASAVSYKTVEEFTKVLSLQCLYGGEAVFVRNLTEMHRRDHSLPVFCMVGES